MLGEKVNMLRFLEMLVSGNLPEKSETFIKYLVKAVEPKQESLYIQINEGKCGFAIDS